MKIIRSLLLLIVIILAILFFARDSIIKSAVSKYGSQSLQTLVEVADVKSDISKKSIELKNITVANIKGFKSKNILELNNFKIVVGDGIDSENIVIDELSINGTTANLEQNTTGVNIVLLADKLDNQIANTEKNATQSESKNEEEHIIDITIKKLSITNSKIIANTQIITGDIKLLDLDFTNISATNKNISAVITKLLLDEVKNAIKKKGVDVVKGKLEKTLTRKIGEKMGLEGETLDEMKHNIKDKTEELKDKLEDKLKDNFKNIFKF